MMDQIKSADKRGFRVNFSTWHDNIAKKEKKIQRRTQKKVDKEIKWAIRHGYSYFSFFLTNNYDISYACNYAKSLELKAWYLGSSNSVYRMYIQLPEKEI